MAQDEKTGILGISLIDDQLRIVESVRLSQNEFEVTQLAQGRIRQRFDFSVFTDKNMPRRFADDITRLYKTQNFKEKKVAFSLDSRMVLVKKIAIDRSLEEELIKGQVKWEVQQFSISPVNEYVIDYEPIHANTNGPFNNMLVVVVRKKIVKFLKEVFKHTDLQLKVVDVDIFSAQRALQLNYDYNNSDKVCLINIEENKIHFSLLHGRSFFLTQEVSTLDNQDIDLNTQSITRLISKELRRIILDHQLGKKIEDLNDIFLYGDAVEDELLEGLQNSYDVHIDRANPFRKIKLNAQIEDVIQSRSERYMVSVGAALRGMQ